MCVKTSCQVSIKYSPRCQRWSIDRILPRPLYHKVCNVSSGTCKCGPHTYTKSNYWSRWNISKEIHCKGQISSRAIKPLVWLPDTQCIASWFRLAWISNIWSIASFLTCGWNNKDSLRQTIVQSRLLISGGWLEHIYRTACFKAVGCWINSIWRFLYAEEDSKARLFWCISPNKTTRYSKGYCWYRCGSLSESALVRPPT